MIQYRVSGDKKQTTQCVACRIEVPDQHPRNFAFRTSAVRAQWEEMQ